MVSTIHRRRRAPGAADGAAARRAWSVGRGLKGEKKAALFAADSPTSQKQHFVKFQIEHPRFGSFEVAVGD